MKINTKLIFGASLLIAWAFMVSLFISGLLLQQDKINSKLLANAKGNLSSGKLLTGSDIILTNEEVVKHNNKNDCWIIVDNKIYDLTSFLLGHSGGSSAMVPYCGKDGTDAYKTKDENPAKTHNLGDINILSRYYVGDLNQAIKTDFLKQKINQTKTLTRESSKDDEEDD